MSTRNRTLLTATAAALIALTLTSCAAISNPDPESASPPAGDTASETVEKYFAAIESSDKEALGKLAAGETNLDKLQFPKEPAKFKAIENAPETNPRPIDRKIASVKVTYTVGSESHLWDAVLRYESEETGWQIIDPFISVDLNTETSDWGEEVEEASTDSDEPLYLPGKHQMDASAASKYLTAPDEGVEVDFLFTDPNDEVGNTQRINDALKDAKFSLSSDGKKAALAEIDAFREKCKNWCEEDYFSNSFSQHDPERKYDAGVFRYAEDASNPDSVQLIDKHSGDWQSWYEDHVGYSNDPAYFILVEPLTIEYSNYDCKYENGSTNCHYAESGSDKYVLDDDVVFIYRIDGEELTLEEVRNNG